LTNTAKRKQQKQQQVIKKRSDHGATGSYSTLEKPGSVDKQLPMKDLAPIPKEIAAEMGPQEERDDGCTVSS
jgi:hypothetical protein